MSNKAERGSKGLADRKMVSRALNLAGKPRSWRGFTMLPSPTIHIGETKTSKYTAIDAKAIGDRAHISAKRREPGSLARVAIGESKRAPRPRPISTFARWEFDMPRIQTGRMI